MAHEPFLALTDEAWFDYLASSARDGRVDEVNFWSPKSQKPMKALAPGEPVFFRLKAPRSCIGGYGFFAHFALLGLREAWDMFGDKNGDPDPVSFLTRIGGYRGVDLLHERSDGKRLGSTILRDAVFWSRDRWLPWGAEQGWHREIVRGKSETDPARASRLLAEIQFDRIEEPPEFSERFVPLEVDERAIALARRLERVGQGAFRSRLLDAYGRRCAITGERTEPVLDAAHVQSYLGPRSNHVQNGLLLTKEFHALFDAGLVTVTPDYRLRVSAAIAQRWSNGKRYYAYDGSEVRVPAEPSLRPSREALEWHGCRLFAG